DARVRAVEQIDSSRLPVSVVSEDQVVPVVWVSSGWYQFIQFVGVHDLSLWWGVHSCRWGSTAPHVEGRRARAFGETALAPVTTVSIGSATRYSGARLSALC